MQREFDDLAFRESVFAWLRARVLTSEAFGSNALLADNVWLRTAMERHLPLVWFIGIGYKPATKTQMFRPQFPVWLVAEEPAERWCT